MTKDELIAYRDKIAEYHNRIGREKTELLETQGVLVDEECYDDAMEMLFEELDDDLFQAKRKLTKLRGILEDKIDSMEE